MNFDIICHFLINIFTLLQINNLFSRWVMEIGWDIIKYLF